MMDKMPGGSPPPLDPKDFPGLQEFLSPGMGDQSDISDIMDIFMGG
jgi:hypothetical protein